MESVESLMSEKGSVVMDEPEHGGSYGWVQNCVYFKHVLQ